MIIRGNTVGALTLRADWNQTDESKMDFIRGKETVEMAIADAKAGNAAHSAARDNPHGVTVAQIGAAAANHSHSLQELGCLTEQRVRAMIAEELGVIEHGTY